MKQPLRALTAAISMLTLLAGMAQGQNSRPAARKTFIDYFLPMPIAGTLFEDVWGAPEVGPRDTKIGLDDVTVKQWYYWDGQIMKAPDGRYHMFASRWDQAKGHRGWGGSKAVHAVSDTLLGPYVDKGLCWPDDQGGKGHNVTALVLPDGRYAIVISETRPGRSMSPSRWMAHGRNWGSSRARASRLPTSASWSGPMATS